MIELSGQQLSFSFPEVHPEAMLQIELQRTLRIPDDGLDYPLPPGLGAFPVQHVDDYAARVPRSWIDRGGVMVPMYQSEAMWLNFTTSYVTDQGSYPFAIKIATGKINAVTGNPWDDGLHRKPQDYVVSPKQPWLDGYAVGKGAVRQFIAMPLCKGYTAEEQLTGKADIGGIQIQVYPMKQEAFEKRFPVKPPIQFSLAPTIHSCAMPSMGIAPGGRIKQQIYKDSYALRDWDLGQTSRCFIHLCNSQQWRSITGSVPPNQPIKAKQYAQAGLPWFDFYNEKTQVVSGSAKLASLDTVADHAKTCGDAPLADNETLVAQRVVKLRRDLKTGQVRESGL